MALDSGEKLRDHGAGSVRQAVMATLVLVRQSRMVDTQTVQNRGLQVVDVDGILKDVIRIIICLS